MKTFPLTRREFEKFRDAQIKSHAHWPAVFSCNANEDVWPFVTYGFTYESERRYLNGKFNLLTRVVREVLQDRPEGGMFFIDDIGVFHGSDGRTSHPVVKFSIQNED